MKSLTDILFKSFGSVAGAEGKLFGWSDEFRKFYSSGYRCPRCNERLINALGSITVNFYSGTGEKISLWQLGNFRAEWAECPKCSYRFKTRGNAPPGDIEVIGIVETERQEESFGTDSRLVDNSKSSGNVRRKFAISKEWSSTYAVEYEQACTKSGGIDLSLTQRVGVKRSCEDSIKRKFSVSEDSRKVYSEEVEIDVPGGTKLRIIFQWKRIFQCGFIQVRKPNNEMLNVPFKVAVGVTFDQTQVDENG